MSIFRGDVLTGRVALITGGGTGICRGIARAFAAHGADVCITSRKNETLQGAADALSKETGREIMAMAADVRDPDQISAVAAAAAERFGHLDTVVNGAAGNFLSPAAGLSPKGFRTVVDIDLMGTFNTCKAAFPFLRERDNGLIINISATLHYHGTPMQIHASAAKAGVDALTRNLAVEWGPSGIRVVAVAPGPIGDTEGMRRLAPGPMGEKMMRMIPMRRFGTIDEIASTAVFLGTETASYISGAIIVVDGGQCVAQGHLSDL